MSFRKNLGLSKLITGEGENMKTVQDIMITGEKNPVVDEKSCFRDVLEAMDIQSLGAVNVVDSKNRLMGIITDGDLRRLMLKTQDTLAELFMKKVTMIMIKNPKTLSTDSSLEECLRLLKKYRFWVVPVVDKENRLSGMVHLHTLLSEI
tara:strand:- start:71 stop:517 length:447 start_codon:yes stop_codon:yes gene_type:complete